MNYDEKILWSFKIYQHIVTLNLYCVRLPIIIMFFLHVRHVFLPQLQCVKAVTFGENANIVIQCYLIIPLAFPGRASAGHCHSNSKHKAEPWPLQEYPHVWPARNWKNSICQGTHTLHNTCEKLPYEPPIHVI